MAENGLQDDFTECPLCMEPLAFDDINFYPCACRYQICRFCWHRIRTDENGLCPHCREPYSENPAEYTPPTQEQMAKLKTEKKQKNVEKRQKIIESRKSLASVRVVQKNLVFVIGLSPRLADPEVLKKNEYFGKFGRIYKVVINNHTVYNGAQGPSVSAYVTYVKNEDASKAITAVNNAYIDGRYLKASFGTTKYCTSFLRGMQCTKADCMYLHELGDDDASFTKEDMQLGKHQMYETATLAALSLPASFRETQQIHQLQHQHSVGGVKIKHVAHKPVVTDNAESALPATASWGSGVKSVQPATNHSSDSAQYSHSKDAKASSNVAVSHSHSSSTSKHKHQQLVKSHSNSPSHGTGTGNLVTSHSKSGKLGSKEIGPQHSRSRSGPLSPSNTNEPTAKKQPTKEHERHTRSNSVGKSTASLSPKSTLSSSSSSSSLKHDVESEGASGESNTAGEAVASGEVSLDTSKDEEGVGEEEGEVEERAEAITGAIEAGEDIEGGGGEWSQNDNSVGNGHSPTTQSQVLEGGTTIELSEEVGEEYTVSTAPVVETATVEEKLEGKQSVSIGENVEATPPTQATMTATPPTQATTTATPPTQATTTATPPTQATQTCADNSTEDSSIVKVIPSFASGASQFGSLGVSWNTALPQQLSSSIDAAPQTPSTEDVATPTSSTHNEDDLGFDPWDVSQQGLADLMKSERAKQQYHSSLPNQPSTNAAPPGTLSNGIGNGNPGSKSSLLQEEFKALFPNVNVSFEGSIMRSVGGSSDHLLSSSLPLSAKPVSAATTASSYVPSRLDSALTSTYHPLLGTSPLPPMTSSSSSAVPGSSLKMFLGQHQPGFPSSSIKVHSRTTGSVSSAVGTGGSQAVGTKLGSSDWPDLGVSITSKPSSSQWSISNSDNSDAGSKDTVAVSIATSSTGSSLPPPPPGFSARTTPTIAPAFPGTAVSTSGTVRAPGTQLNNTVNHSLWTGGVGGTANLKGIIAGNHLLQSWANFMKFRSLTPAQQQQLARGSQMFQQLLIQQQYLIRQSLLIQSHPYYQAQAQALAQAQASLRAQLQQNVLRQQQVAAAMAATGQKIVNSSAASTPASSTNNSVSVAASQSGNHSQQTAGHSSAKALPNSEAGTNTSSKGDGESVSTLSHASDTHQRPHSQQMTNSTKQNNNRTPSSKPVKNSGSSHAPHSGQNTERKFARLKAK